MQALDADLYPTLPGLTSRLANMTAMPPFETQQTCAFVACPLLSRDLTPTCTNRHYSRVAPTLEDAYNPILEDALDPTREDVLDPSRIERFC
jgi:hypothetical protein